MPLLDTPLDELLAKYDVELTESSITDREFFGALVERRDGHWFLAMPPARSWFERDTVARMLLADGMGIPAPRVSWPLEVTHA